MREPIGNEFDGLPIEQLADMRHWQLKRLELITRALKQSVIEQAANGTPISSLAKRSGVTRPTLYAWLAE